MNENSLPFKPVERACLIAALRLRGASNQLATATGSIQHRLELAWRTYLCELDMTSFPKYDRDAFVAVQFVISPLLEKKISLEQALSKERAWDLAEKLLWIADEIGESFVCGRQKFFSSLAPKPEPLDGQSRARREPPDERLVELERTFSLGVYELVKADGSLSDRLSSAWNNHIRNSRQNRCQRTFLDRLKISMTSSITSTWPMKPCSSSSMTSCCCAN